jgi:hypothetical protein
MPGVPSGRECGCAPVATRPNPALSAINREALERVRLGSVQVSRGDSSSEESKGQALGHVFREEPLARPLLRQSRLARIDSVFAFPNSAMRPPAIADISAGVLTRLLPPGALTFA